MELDLLTAISPIDGRYRGKAEALADYFSEYALIKYRVQVEVEYFITLCELPLPQLKGIDKSVFEALRATGDVNYPFYVGFVVQWSVAVGCGFLFGIHW